MIEACARKDSPAIDPTARHTWASLAVMAGVPLMVVARNMGHADTRMVERHYGHLAPSYIADAIRAGARGSASSPIIRSQRWAGDPSWTRLSDGSRSVPQST